MGSTFRLPAQQRAAWLRRPSPTKTARAVAAVDLTDLSSATGQFNAMLDALNGAAMGARRRMQCLETFVEPSRHLTDVLAEQLAFESVPLSESALSQIKHLEDLWWKLAAGYLLVFRDSKRYKAARRAASGLSALEALGQMLLMYYHEYASVPSGAWHAVHECYESTVKSKPAAGIAAELDRVYKQVLIMGGTGPYRLRQSEQAALYQVLSSWAAQVRIRNSRNSQAKGSTLVFRTNDDEAPTLYPFDQLPETRNLSLIDTAPLAAHAHHRLSLIESNKKRQRISGETLGADTLRALIAAWSGSPQRRFPRVQVGRGLHLYVGLERIHTRLRDRQAVACMEGHVLNESATGFSITLDQPNPGSLVIGELVLAEHGNSDGTILGMVRWLRRAADENWIAGVEAIAREARPATLIKRDSTQFPALVLPANAAAYAPASLVVPEILAGDQDDFHLHDNEQETPVSLERQIERSASFCQYRIS